MSGTLTPAAVTRWLRERIAEMAPGHSGAITTRTTFMDLGISSSQGVELVDDLERWTGVEVPVTLVYDYPTVGLAAEEICRLRTAGVPVAGS